MKFTNLRPPIAIGGVAVLAVGLAVAVGPTASAQQPTSDDAPQSAVLTGACLNSTARLTVEEARLSATLAQNDNDSELQPKSFALQMIEGAGFENYGPQLVAQLCGARTYKRARRIVTSQGKRLWAAAVDRAQRKGQVRGSLPYSDDRPLYWANMQGEAVIQQFMPRFLMTEAQRVRLVTSYDEAARGMDSISFPRGDNVRRVILSGFDPYTLDGGQTGSAPGAVGNNIRHGNPSGAIALAMDNTSYRPAHGSRVYIQTYMLPVDFPQFKAGYIEDTVGPFMKPGPEQVDASITTSQAGPDEFHLEQWNGRYHGVSEGNLNFEPCPRLNGSLELAVDNPQCNIQVVPNWGGPRKFKLKNPPQFTNTTLPIRRMIEARTGTDVSRPPGDQWPDQSQAFGVIWHTNYTEFPSCRSNVTIHRNSPVPTDYPPATPPTPPDRHACAESGGGGNYLSNESAYRNTLLRDRLRVAIPAGHIHTPYMQHFASGDLYGLSDSTFDAYRLAIVHQGEELVDVIASSAPTPRQVTRNSRHYGRWLSRHSYGHPST